MNLEGLRIAPRRGDARPHRARSPPASLSIGIITGSQPSACDAVSASAFGLSVARWIGMCGRTGGEAQGEAALQREQLAVVLQRLVAHQHVEDLDRPPSVRVSDGSKRTPWKCSMTCAPLVPKPAIMRPPESSSSVAKCCASAAGVRE